MLEVRAFGTVRAARAGEPLDLGGPRQRAVLGVLVAADRRTVSTDRFLDELWSGEPPPSATGALHAYVSRLRGLLEPQREKRRPASVLVSNPPGYALALPTDAVDTWRFASLVAEAVHLDDAEAVRTLDEALALWQDPPFAEYAEQEWAATEAARLHELRAEAVELRAAAGLRLGRGAQAVRDLETHVREHPLREEAAGLLARAYYQAGRQADALVTLAAVRERLVEELGVDPGPALRQLEADVLQQAAHLTVTPQPAVSLAPAAAPAEPAAPAADDPELVGREDELARLDAAARAVRHRAGLVWVEGDAGFGKSALVARFGDASVADWSVVRGHCSEVAGAPPGYAWLEVVAALGGPPPGVDPDGDAADDTDDSDDTGAVEATPFALADTLRRRLEERGTRTLVLLEDLHRADDETLQVLWHVVDATEAPVLVVATFRSHEVGRDLGATLALTADRTLDRIALHGLGPSESRELLARYLSGPLLDSVAAQVVDRSAGNPLFLRQLAQLVDSEGAGAADTLPAAIRDLLLRRIERLPEPTVEALSRAAVLGRDLDLDLVVALEQQWGDAAEDVVADHLDAGLVAGLLEAPRPGELRFSHALVRDTFYGRLPPMRRHRLHRAALAAYRSHAPDRVDEMAHHATAGLDRRTAADAVPLLLAAAAGSGYAAAVPHLRTALRALELAGADPRASFPVRADLVRALARDGATTAATLERREAVAAARAHGDVLDVARAWRWPAPMMWSRSASEVADPSVLAELHDLLDAVGHDDPALRIELLNALVVEADPWNLAECRAAGEEAVALAEELGDPELLCRALNAAYFSTFTSTDTGLLERRAQRMLAAAESAGLHGYVAVAHVQLQSAAVGRGDLGTAASHIEAAVRAGTSGQLPELLLLSSIFEATTRLLGGDLDSARRGFEEVARLVGDVGDPNAFYIRLWSLFAVEFAAGDTSGLRDDARRMTELLPWHSSDIHAVTLLDAGEVEEARAVWDPRPQERDATWLFDAAVRAHLAVELGDVEQARRSRADLLPWSGQLTRSLNGALSLGPVDHFLARLSGLLGDDAAAQRHAEQARRLVEGACGALDTWRPGWARS